MTSQHCRETQKSRSDCCISLKGAKFPVVVLRAEESYYTIKRSSQQIVGAATTGPYFSELPGRGYSGGAYNVTDIFYTRNFDALAESGLLEFQVPMVCLATGCVSRHRD